MMLFFDLLFIISNFSQEMIEEQSLRDLIVLACLSPRQYGHFFHAMTLSVIFFS